MHAVVDDRDSHDESARTNKSHHALPAVLQLPRRLPQEPSKRKILQLHGIDRAWLTFSAQYWRLLTTFVYFGPLSLDLVFHVFFMQRYSRMLEESSGRSPAHFSWLLACASAVILCIAPMFSMAFLGTALSSVLVYIWSRRNPDTRLSFLGMFVFRAPYLPFVLMAFSIVLHNHIPKDEICGVVVGHGEFLLLWRCDNIRH